MSSTEVKMDDSSRPSNAMLAGVADFGISFENFPQSMKAASSTIGSLPNLLLTDLTASPGDSEPKPDKAPRHDKAEEEVNRSQASGGKTPDAAGKTEGEAKDKPESQPIASKDATEDDEVTQKIKEKLASLQKELEEVTALSAARASTRESESEVARLIQENMKQLFTGPSGMPEDWNDKDLKAALERQAERDKTARASGESAVGR